MVQATTATTTSTESMLAQITFYKMKIPKTKTFSQRTMASVLGESGNIIHCHFDCGLGINFQLSWTFK